jgi:hypothetical protein
MNPANDDYTTRMIDSQSTGALRLMSVAPQRTAINSVADILCVATL